MRLVLAKSFTSFLLIQQFDFYMFVHYNNKEKKSKSFLSQLFYTENYSIIAYMYIFLKLLLMGR